MITLTSFILARQPPVALMHGIGDDAASLSTLIDTLKKSIPDLYIKNCEIGTGKLSSITTPMNESITEFQRCVVSDPNLKDGFIGLGHSQGGYILRGYLENRTKDMPKMVRFISMAAPLAGFYCGVTTECVGKEIHEWLNNLAVEVIYSDWFQALVGASNYWKDPYNLQIYEQMRTNLLFLDNEINYQENYRQNFMQVDKIVLFASESDGDITPWQSGWFGYYNEGDDQNIVPMEETNAYIKDLFGLRSMDEQGRVIRIDSHQTHTGNINNVSFIEGEVVQWVEMDY